MRNLIVLILLLVGGVFLYFKVTKPILPVPRMIVNSAGKSLEVLVQGKIGDTLYVDRVADGERFEIQIPTLSPGDRFFAMRLDEEPPPVKEVEKEEARDDSFVASRTKQIAEMKDKAALIKQELKSGTLSDILAAKRKEDLDVITEDIKKLEIGIQEYKYRNRQK
jgi:hypothetical protein